jgi:hypothetical protein
MTNNSPTSFTKNKELQQAKMKKGSALNCNKKERKLSVNDE